MKKKAVKFIDAELVLVDSDHSNDSDDFNDSDDSNSK